MVPGKMRSQPQGWHAPWEKEDLFPYCLFLQDSFSSPAGVDTLARLQGCLLQESCALKSYSDTATTGIKSRLLARQRSPCAVVRVAWHLEQGQGVRDGRKKIPQEECEAHFLIQRRKHFQQKKNRHYLLFFIYYENKAWHGRKKMGFVIQMTCVLNPALTLPVSDREGIC